MFPLSHGWVACCRLSPPGARCPAELSPGSPQIPLCSSAPECQTNPTPTPNHTRRIKSGFEVTGYSKNLAGIIKSRRHCREELIQSMWERASLETYLLKKSFNHSWLPVICLKQGSCGYVAGFAGKQPRTNFNMDLETHYFYLQKLFTVFSVWLWLISCLWFVDVYFRWGERTSVSVCFQTYAWVSKVMENKSVRLSRIGNKSVEAKAQLWLKLFIHSYIHLRKRLIPLANPHTNTLSLTI